MNNKGQAEGFIFLLILMVVSMGIAMKTGMQWNGNVEKQKRFRIDDKVYQCSLIKSFTVEDEKSE